ncbi:LacI family DNA-binding transcriptional regulator [Saccharopolyspora erythraea]|uniref:LacI family DNA-binding transcriptional regulator n=1 Tax=Saccharopolyspora erythraea TaxID=1836 RepID=UPI001BACD5FB|nr:LacI family DNA-binding transcriptional regulator [Saccharopolyspora erythraea]QUH04060.1 LacI family DNA-binding transcriptional regulator [Saccharopolyspora erythraea]
MTKAVTIKHVAARAGVSVGTASRVLSGNPATSSEARTRVRAAAEELGYRPDARARGLRSTRSNAIGLLVSDVRNPFFADIAYGAERAALRAGHVTLLANADEDTRQQDTYLDTFLSQRVDGMIVAPQGAGGGNLRSAVEAEVPLVFVDRTVDGFDVPSVTADNEGGIAQAVAHLAARGHTRIGYIGGPRSISTGRARHDAFVRAVAANGLDDDTGLITVGDFQSASGALATARLISGERPPTALLAADSPMAMGALTELRARGLRTGSDIGLVAFDDTEWFAELDPPITAVRQAAREMGETAMRLLLEVIAGGAPDSVVLPTELIVRESSGAAATELS